MAKKPITFTVTMPLENMGGIKAEDYRVTIEPDDPITKCTIEAQFHPISKAAWRLAGLGIGVRKHRDRYNLEIGCKNALKSALKHVKNEATRAAIWTAFLEVFPPDAPKPAKVDDAEMDAFARFIAKSFQRTLERSFIGHIGLGGSI